MANRHYKKWMLQMPVGFILVACGILLIVYAGNKRAAEDWLNWGVVAAIIVTVGLGILGSSFVHKVKSDLIRKGRKHLEQEEDQA